MSNYYRGTTKKDMIKFRKQHLTNPGSGLKESFLDWACACPRRPQPKYTSCVFSEQQVSLRQAVVEEFAWKGVILPFSSVWNEPQKKTKISPMQRSRRMRICFVWIHVRLVQVIPYFHSTLWSCVQFLFSFFLFLEQIPSAQLKMIHRNRILKNFRMFYFLFALTFSSVCRTGLLHSEFWALLNKSPRQRAALQPRGRDLHQHHSVWTGQPGAAGQGPVQNGESFIYSVILSTLWQHYLPSSLNFCQAEEEARRNRLMRDMAQLRLQVFLSFSPLM